MKKINEYLLILIGCSVLFTSCKVLEATWEIPKAMVGVPVAIGESLGILEEEEKVEEKVVGGKVVKVNSKGEIVPSSTAEKSHKVNIGYLIWWTAVFTLIALVIHFFVKKYNERRG